MKANRKKVITANTLICNPVFEQMKQVTHIKIVDYIILVTKKIYDFFTNDKK